MAHFNFGLVHAPLTPFTSGRIDYDAYGKLIDFHLRNGAEGLALPMHAGESVSLTVEERKALLEFVAKHVRGRAPVIANVSEAGTGIAASLAAHARQAGASALIASVPYYWTPPQSMLVEHFAAIGAAGELPFFVYNSPSEMSEVEFASKSVVDLLGTLAEFCRAHRCQPRLAVHDRSRDCRARCRHGLSIRLRNRIHDLGRRDRRNRAAVCARHGITASGSQTLRPLSRREVQGRAQGAGGCRNPLPYFPTTGAAGLKAAVRVLGRDCGSPRPPLPAFDDARTQALIAEMSAVETVNSEPRGWL